MDLVQRAFGEAARFNDNFVATHHLVLALLSEPSVAAEALIEQEGGVKRS